MQHLLIYLTVAILSATYASPTSPVVSSQPQPCNTCCQGPSGLPGIPGPGHNGLPGRDGLRGEKGDIGSPGMRGGSGPVGSEGLSGGKGDQGLQGLLGLPGKVGPQGLKGGKGDIGSRGLDGEKGDGGSAGMRGESGPVGSEGVSGEKGDRGLRGLQGLPGRGGSQGLKGLAGVDGHGLPGEQGQKGELGRKGESGDRNGRSAFTALKTSAQTGRGGDVLTFQEALTNIGNNFNVDTSRFTCQIPGVYWFTFTMCRSSSGDPYVFLMKDGTNILVSQFYDSPNHNVITTSTNGAVLQLAAGEQVWVKMGNGQRVFSDGSKHTSFSGFLLYEI